jgi:hypothetical protein
MKRTAGRRFTSCNGCHVDAHVLGFTRLYVSVGCGRKTRCMKDAGHQTSFMT